jgi:hypothetical protein
MAISEEKYQKKLKKQQYKIEKKKRKAALKAALSESHADAMSTSSLYVRFAESIKGILYIILAISIIVAVVLGESGLILTLEDIIDSLIIANLGKVLISIIALALFIYGLKNLRIMK